MGVHVELTPQHLQAGPAEDYRYLQHGGSPSTQTQLTPTGPRFWLPLHQAGEGS